MKIFGSEFRFFHGVGNTGALCLYIFIEKFIYEKIFQKGKMVNYSTIYLKRSVIEELKRLKVSPSESYNDVILRLVKYRGFDVSDGLIVFQNNANVKVGEHYV